MNLSLLQVFGFIVATVFIILSITLAIKVQLQNIDNLGKVAGAEKKFSGAKVAGSFYLLNGQDVGVRARKIETSKKNGYCLIDGVPGFGGEGSLRLVGSGCKMPFDPMQTVYIHSGQVHKLRVGRRLE